MNMPIMGAYIAEDEIMYFPKGVRPMSEADDFLRKLFDERVKKEENDDIINKIREHVAKDIEDVTEDIEQYGSRDKSSTVFLHKVIDSYLLLQIFDKLEIMTLTLDAMLDYKSAEWHERKTK